MRLKLLIAEDAPDVAEVVAFGARMTWPECEVTVASSGLRRPQRAAWRQYVRSSCSVARHLAIVPGA